MESEEEDCFCNNCKRYVASANFPLHSAFCERNIFVCTKCEEPVKISEKDQHLEEYHDMSICNLCEAQLEKWLLPNHMDEVCPKRLVECKYCESNLPVDEFAEHVEFCGSRTEKLLLCRKYVMVKDKSIDDEIHQFENQYLTKSIEDEFKQVNEVISKESTTEEICEKILQREKKQSSSSQADVSGRVIDKENTTYQELSSLDTKDVTLLLESMKELLIKGNDHDVKITVKDKQFQAHRLILRTRSPVFAMMLTHDSKESLTGTINIEDCDPDSFDEFLLYLYSGRTENLTPAKALHLYYTADKYDVPALKKRCAILLKTSLSVKSICDVLLLATRHNEKELLEQATKFFAQNMREILVTVHWQKFLSKYPIEGNELYIKSMEILVPRK